MHSVSSCESRPGIFYAFVETAQLVSWKRDIDLVKILIQSEVNVNLCNHFDRLTVK